MRVVQRLGSVAVDPQDRYGSSQPSCILLTNLGSRIAHAKTSKYTRPEPSEGMKGPRHWLINYIGYLSVATPRTCHLTMLLRPSPSTITLNIEVIFKPEWRDLFELFGVQFPTQVPFDRTGSYGRAVPTLFCHVSISSLHRLSIYPCLWPVSRLKTDTTTFNIGLFRLRFVRCSEDHLLKLKFFLCVVRLKWLIWKGMINEGILLE